MLALALAAVAEAQAPAAPAALSASLRQGGYVIFFRHAEAEEAIRPGAVEALPADLRDCQGTNRPLTDAGLAQARAAGAAIRALRIPVGRLIASPSCRCVETAWYAFERRPETAADLARTAGAGEAMRRLLATPPGAGTNTVVVGHISNLLAVARVSIEQGDALVFEPLAGGGFRVVGRVAADGWSLLDP